MVVRDEGTGRLALSCDKGSLEASVGLSPLQGCSLSKRAPRYLVIVLVCFGQIGH